MFGNDNYGYDTSYDWAEDLANEKMKSDRKKELKNEKRDKRGRLEKGSRIASKLSCDKSEILYLYKSGHSVKQIVEYMGCSKSTVYNAVKDADKSDRLDMDSDSSFEDSDSPFVDSDSSFEDLDSSHEDLYSPYEDLDSLFVD